MNIRRFDENSRNRNIRVFVFSSDIQNREKDREINIEPSHVLRLDTFPGEIFHTPGRMETIFDRKIFDICQGYQIFQIALIVQDNVVISIDRVTDNANVVKISRLNVMIIEIYTSTSISI